MLLKAMIGKRPHFHAAGTDSYNSGSCITGLLALALLLP